MSDLPASLHGIRPAQAGIVMRGRSTCGHISATIVDLALRDVIQVEQLSDGTAIDWLLTLRSQPSELAAYEGVLLRALFGTGDRLSLTEFTGSRASGIRHVAAALRRDAVRAGWLRRWRKGVHTQSGEQFRSEVQTFLRALRDDDLPAETMALRRLLPYAMVSGLVTRPEQAPQPYGPLVSFALAWTARCESLPGRRPHMSTSGPQTSYSEHYQPPPSGGGGDGVGF